MNWLYLLPLLISATVARGEDIRIATAANFAPTLERLAHVFEAQYGHRLVQITGSTGKLAFQILQGAPFDVFLTADGTTADRILKANPTWPKEKFIFANGRLAMIFKKPNDSELQKKPSLDNFDFIRQQRHIALANPDSAPYGEAARAFLQKHGLWNEIKATAVYGENVSQTLQFILSDAVDLAFVAWAQARKIEDQKLQRFLIPLTDHNPLAHEALLLPSGQKKMPAQQFFSFLKSRKAKELIRDAGYE